MTDVIAMVVETIDRMIDLEAAREAVAATEYGRRPELWDRLEELGLSRLALAEADGGAECGWPGLCEVIRAFARSGAPGPLPEEATARALLAEAGLPQPGGIVVLADPRHTRVVQDGCGLSGTVGRVAHGRHADMLLLVAGGDAEAQIALVDVTGLEWHHASNMAGMPRDHVSLSGARADLADLPHAGLRLSRAGALLRSAQIAGATERMFGLSVAYAAERRQFGKPLAAFQAVQQMLARLAEESVAATVAARAAFAAEGTAQANAWAAAAKVRTGDAAAEAAAIAHQVHGAIGFTREHHLRYFSQSALSWKQEFGAPEDWAEQLTAAICDGRSDPWDRLVRIGAAVGAGS